MKLPNGRMAELTEEFLSILATRLAESSLRVYRADTQCHLGYVNKRNNGQPLDATSYRSYCQELLDLGYAGSSLRRRTSVLKRFYDFLMSEGIVSENPIADFSTKELPAYLKFSTAISSERIDKLRRYFSIPAARRDSRSYMLFYRSAFIFEAVLAHGFLPSELLSMRWSEQGDGCLILRKPKIVYVSMNSIVERALDNYQNSVPADSIAFYNHNHGADTCPLLLNTTGEVCRSRDIRSEFAKPGRLCGVPGLSCRSLRSTFIVRQVNDAKAGNLTMDQLREGLRLQSSDSSHCYIKRLLDQVKPEVSSLI